MTCRMKWNEKVDRQIQRICVVLSIIFLVNSIAVVFNPLRLLIGGQQAEAIITDVIDTFGWDTTIPHMDAIDYRFVMGSQVITNRGFLNRGVYRPGDRVSVRYLPSSPAVATIRPLLYSFGGFAVYFLASLLFFGTYRFLTRCKDSS